MKPQSLKCLLILFILTAPSVAVDKKPIKVYLMAGQSNVEGHNYFGEEFETFDEVGIWSRPLTEEEVMTLYNQGCGVSLGD